ncbi:MAG: hypothetical protein ACFFEU_02900 [Candidatus Thorarchaeota archaeon]
MRRRSVFLIITLGIMLVWFPYSTPSSYSWQPEIADNQDQVVAPDNTGLLAASENQTGLLDSLVIEQSGADAEAVSQSQVRTDLVHYPQCSLDLDVESDWKATQIEVNVSNLEKLYALNGTFNQGFPGVNLNPNGGVLFHPLGWDAYSHDNTFYQYQRASYIDQSPYYVSVENEGREYTNFGNLEQYRHYSGTYVLWSQQINSVPSTEDFLFSIDLLYDSGPLGSRYRGDFFLRAVLRDGFTVWPIWELDPTSLSERDAWFEVDSVPVSLSSLHSTLEIEVSLTIQNQMDINWDDSNCDGDPGNAKFIRAFFDNVSFVAATPPEFNAVGLQASIQPVGMTPFVGTGGVGRALVSHSFWESSPITVTLSSSLPVSFDYEARFSHVVRWFNSSPNKVRTNHGVSYSVDFGRNPRLTLYTYIEYHGDYSNFTVRFNHPRDWENATVLDPFSSDVTEQCSIGQEDVEMQGSILDSLGWWSVSFDSPNYAMNAITQWYDDTSTMWQDETVFTSGDDIRASFVIGTLNFTPPTVNGIDLSWNLPNGSIWSSEQVSWIGGFDILSTSLVLGPYNTTPGDWRFTYLWINGSEVAYGKADFELHHSLEVISAFTSIQAELGTNATGAIWLNDADNGNALLDGLATVVGNWSGISVQFRPNLAKGWWEADFNTTLTGTGNFTVLVNASRNFYADASALFEIRVITDTELKFMDDEHVEIGLAGTYSSIFRYQYLDETGISDASIQVKTWTGPIGGLNWGVTTPVSGEPGNYSMDFSATLSGTYHITVSGSKAYHKTSTSSFYLVVGKIETSIILLNESAATIDAESNYTVAIQYLNITGEGLNGADVSVISISPATGLNYSISSYHGNGTYSIFLQPENHGTYSLIIGASLVNHESQFASFTLTVSPLASILAVETSADQIATDRNYTLILTFQDESLVGLEDASISVFSVTPSMGIGFSNFTDLGNGNYSVTLIPILSGNYEIVFRAALARYQNATAVFTLYATDAETTLRTSDGSDIGYVYINETLQIILLFERTDIGENVSLATIEIEYVEGIRYNTIEQLDRYILQVNSSVLGTHFLTIRASKAGYQTSILLFGLAVQETPASIIGSGPPAIMYSGSPCVFTLWYNLSDTTGINGATINITYARFNTTWIEVGNGYYEFSFTPSDKGLSTISIRFSKYGVQMKDRSYTFDVRDTPTSVTCSDIPPIFYLTRTYEICLFLNSSTINGVEGADFTPSVQIESFFEFQAEGHGWYNFTLTPTILGNRNATFHFAKSGFEPRDFGFIMTVEMIPLEISPGFELVAAYNVSEFSSMEIDLKLISGDTGVAIVDATVECIILNYMNLEPLNPMPQYSVTETGGLYTIEFELPEEGLYVLNITVSKLDHETISLTALLDVKANFAERTMNAILFFLPFGAQLIGIFAAVILGRQAYKRRAARRKLELLDYESRFDDASSIIGFFVIHRTTGLPVYSKVLKGGLEEALVSGFISAISQFRSELDEEERLWTAVPISEIITAVHTEAMICAIFTTSTPSPRQIESLEALGRAIGALFDQETDTLFRITMTTETADMFETTFSQIFRDYFDGYLLDVYWGLNKELLTREYRPLEKAMAELDTGTGVKPMDLVKAMLLAGTNELKAYRLVVDAIEDGLLISLETGSHMTIDSIADADEVEEEALADDDDPNDIDYEGERMEDPDDSS